MLTSRLVVCLDVSAGRVMKGTQFQNLRDVGDPVELAASYEAAGADEIVFLDISATVEDRMPLLDAIRRTAEQLFIPLAVGGGIRTLDDAMRALDSGADKVAVNSAAIERPQILTEIADRIGRQCVVASIDAKLIDGDWRVVTHGGRRITDRRAADWAVECEQSGAGEIVLTSIDKDGSRSGYDIALTLAVSDAVNIPVVASGGAGRADDVVEVIQRGKAQAALVAGILHEGVVTVREIKNAMRAAGLVVRAAA